MKNFFITRDEIENGIGYFTTSVIQRKEILCNRLLGSVAQKRAGQHSGNSPELYSGVARFESLPGHVIVN
jgi:hypothetical protein